MESTDVVRAWGRILSGYPTALSIEITKECPLSCPGCYAYQPEHLGGASLTSVSDFKGDALVERVLALVAERRPLVVYFVGGEPLVRFRELSAILPRLAERKISARVVTSAVRPIPMEWSRLNLVGVVVSVDGLQPEHDERRKPATYSRILKHIEGHHIVVHCTVTSQMMKREGYLEEFVDFWSRRPEVKGIEVSFFTPQVGEQSPEILTAEMRRNAVAVLRSLAPRYRKLVLNDYVLEAYLDPPQNPSECIFATVTECRSPDLETIVSPCQFGGNPNCRECGCLGSIGLHAVGERQLAFGVKLRSLFKVSNQVGRLARAVRDRRTLPQLKKASRLGRGGLQV
ncbi:MAG TPA: radical SAM protein [Vicinamibacteria bacterium]|nr:radical SAM protein [Vicinamibacteria bacterium]